jgi:hypothetical protein
METKMTVLTASQIMSFVALLSGGETKRAASKEEAIKRFRKVCDEKGIEAEFVLSAGSVDEARSIVIEGTSHPDEEVPAFLKTNRIAAIAEVAPEPETRSPGLRRLRAAANAEAIRQSVLADQEKAGFVPSREVEETTNTEAGSSRSRIDQTAKIKIVRENPKKPGSRAHARFALYQNDQTVKEFISACAEKGFPEREAAADLSWDRRKGFIEVVAA